MKSGLEGRNNATNPGTSPTRPARLNEVRPRRPEQSSDILFLSVIIWCLNEVRPRRPEQSTLRRSSSAPVKSLNEVRPRRPEQCPVVGDDARWVYVSMKSGLEGRNNYHPAKSTDRHLPHVSMKSGLEGRNNALHLGNNRTESITSLNEVRPRRPEQWIVEVWKI